MENNIEQDRVLKDAIKRMEKRASSRPSFVPVSSAKIGSWPTVSSEDYDEFQFENTVQSIAYEAARILVMKHHDYGPDNINNAPGGAMNGLLVRMHDKMERLKTLLLSGKEPKYESIEDTFLDIINYSIIALMVQREQWPK